MWCIPPAANAEFVYHMEDVLDVYHRPPDPQHPLVCLDEATKQLIGAGRDPRPAKSGEVEPAILNLHERIENKLFLDRTRKDSNFERPHICATLFLIEKCWHNAAAGSRYRLSAARSAPRRAAPPTGKAGRRQGIRTCA